MREFRILFVLLPAMFLLGCDKDFHPGLGKPQEVEVTLASLAVADAVVVEPMGSRSAAVSADDGGGLFTVGLGSGKGVDAPAGGSVSSRADMGLSNVWVLQFDAAGKTKACAYVGTVAAGQKVKAALQSGEGYTVWIVANGPAAGGFTTSNPASLSDFESGMLHTAVPASDGLIPLSGKLTGVRILDNGQVLVGGDNAIVPEVTLSRAMARVDVLLEYDVSGAVLDGVWLYQVPAGACYGLDGSVTNYPASDVESNFLYRDGMSAGQAPASSGSGTVTHTWYIGDNRRGENASILWEKNKGEKNAPKMAAYARIKSHEAGDVNKGLFHDVYLGDNVTTNFDVLRNRHYIYRVRIGGTLDQQKALALTDDRVWAGMLEYLEGAPTITPSLDEEIPLGGRTFTVRFNGYWTGAGIPVRARVGEQALAEAKAVCQDGTGEATLAIPANDGPQRSIMFEYQWKGQWIPVGAGTQEAYQPVVGNLYGGGVIYWVNPKDAEDFRVVRWIRHRILRSGPSTQVLCWARALRMRTPLTVPRCGRLPSSIPTAGPVVPRIISPRISLRSTIVITRPTAELLKVRGICPRLLSCQSCAMPELALNRLLSITAAWRSRVSTIGRLPSTAAASTALGT